MALWRPLQSEPSYDGQTCGVLGAFLLLLYEAQNIEVLDLTVWEEAVDGFLFFIENLEDSGKLREQDQLQVPAIQVGEFQRPAGFLQRHIANHHGAQAGTIYV